MFKIITNYSNIIYITVVIKKCIEYKYKIFIFQICNLITKSTMDGILEKNLNTQKKSYLFSFLCIFQWC